MKNIFRKPVDEPSSARNTTTHGLQKSFSSFFNVIDNTSDAIDLNNTSANTLLYKQKKGNSKQQQDYSFNSTTAVKKPCTMVALERSDSSSAGVSLTSQWNKHYGSVHGNCRHKDGNKKSLSNKPDELNDLASTISGGESADATNKAKVKKLQLSSLSELAPSSPKTKDDSVASFNTNSKFNTSQRTGSSKNTSGSKFPSIRLQRFFSRSPSKMTQPTTKLLGSTSQSQTPASLDTNSLLPTEQRNTQNDALPTLLTASSPSAATSLPLQKHTTEEHKDKEPTADHSKNLPSNNTISIVPKTIGKGKVPPSPTLNTADAEKQIDNSNTKRFTMMPRWVQLSQKAFTSSISLEGKTNIPDSAPERKTAPQTPTRLSPRALKGGSTATDSKLASLSTFNEQWCANAGSARTSTVSVDENDSTKTNKSTATPQAKSKGHANAPETVTAKQAGARPGLPRTLPSFLRRDHSSSSSNNADASLSNVNLFHSLVLFDSQANLENSGEDDAAANKDNDESRVCTQYSISDKELPTKNLNPDPRFSAESCNNDQPEQYEEDALSKYLNDQELNLAYSTFTVVGAALARSHTLRTLNLRGSTTSSEGLRGLANVPTLEVVCVSHMRNLTSLVPLITPTDTAQCCCRLQEIDAQCTSLTSDGLRGLEQLPYLRCLDLSMTRVNDVSFLSISKTLEELFLSVTQVTSAGLQGLERIPTLKTLNICRTKVTCLRSLVRSRSLQTLLMYSCKSTDSDVKGLELMPQLATLDLSTTKVTNLSFLRMSRSLRSLKAQWLNLRNCADIIRERRAAQQQQLNRTLDTLAFSKDQEEGYAGLAEIPTLETLDLSFNTIRSVNSLCSCSSLKHLYLRRTKINTDGIEHLSRLAWTLETLIITNRTDAMEEEEAAAASTRNNSLLSSINPIVHLSKLTKLDLSDTDVYDLRELQCMKMLKELILVETLITVEGLCGIEKIDSLEFLDISQTSVLSLHFLITGAKSLTKIVVKSNRNTRGFRLGHIESLPALETLDLSDTVVEDIGMLQKPAWKLKELIWRWGERREATGPVPSLPCWVTSERLAGLGKMPRLSKLDFTNSAIHDLNFLEGSRSIETLVLDNCGMLRDSSLWLIASFKSTLRSLTLSNNPAITDVSCLTPCTKLEELVLMNTSVTAVGMTGVYEISSLKRLDITNTKAEESMMYIDAHESTLHTASGKNTPIKGEVMMASRSSTAKGLNGSKSNSEKDTGSHMSLHTLSNTMLTKGSIYKCPGNSLLKKQGHASGREDRKSQVVKSHRSNSARSSRCSRLWASGSLKLDETVSVLDSSVTPSLFRLPRRRRVSFIMTNAPENQDENISATSNT